MKKTTLLIVIALFLSIKGSSQQLNVTGGVSLTKGAINTDVLSQVIQQKQTEVFNRLFQNIIVQFFKHEDAKTGIYNFPTYYSLYNLVSDLTVGKSKTTVSKAVINSLSEIVYVYAFVKFYQNLENANAQGNFTAKTISKVKLVDNVANQQVNANEESLKTVNSYLEAAFDVLAKSPAVQKKFYFEKPITSSEISTWYSNFTADFKRTVPTFKDIVGHDQSLGALETAMTVALPDFLNYAPVNPDPIIQTIANLSKDATGIQKLTSDQLNAIRLLLLEFATKSDFLFSHNVVKILFNLLSENIHFGIDDNQDITEIYVDVDGLILSVANEFVSKNTKSSISSGAWFINPRLFFTIGTSTSFFLNNANGLDKDPNGKPTPLKNVSFASEKIGFRVKVWDGGYTRSFGPGEVYKWHGSNYVWTQPQPKPLISSVYYSLYASGLLYNVVNLKTNQNFTFGFVGSNIGVIFFNGLELSAGVGIVYQHGLDATNSFFKLDFDIPIVDYLSALTAKKGN